MKFLEERNKEIPKEFQKVAKEFSEQGFVKISLGNIGALGFWSMMIFLFILTIGFIYEWKKGALDWD